MMRAGALRRLTAGLFLVSAIAIGTTGCILAPIPGPFVGAPVIVAPRPYYGGGYYRGGYYHGGHRRGHDQRWR